MFYVAFLRMSRCGPSCALTSRSPTLLWYYTGLIIT